MREAFAALVTLVGFLSRVQPAVLNQVVLVLEGLVADLALMRTLACNKHREIIYDSSYKEILIVIYWNLFDVFLCHKQFGKYACKVNR